MTRAAVGDAPAIDAEIVRKRFGSTHALRGCSLTVRQGEFVSLLGPSGCGKTTLLRIIAGLERQDSGTVRVMGIPVDGLPPNRRPCRMVFQRYALFPHMSVFDNVAYSLRLQGVGREELRPRVGEMLDLVHLAGVEQRSPSELSGGQAQRVALARSLISRPPVLLLDEPLAALDLKLRRGMQIELRHLQERLGTAFLYVTHDQEEALVMSDRIELMREGEIVQEGTPRDIYDNPVDAFSSDFLGEANLIPADVLSISGESTLVSLGGQTVKGPPYAGEPGQKVLLCLRPERATLAGVDGVGISISASVSRVVFLGHLTRIYVALQGGALMAVEQQPSAPVPEPGAEVTVTWKLEDSRLLPLDRDI